MKKEALHPPKAGARSTVREPTSFKDSTTHFTCTKFYSTVWSIPMGSNTFLSRKDKEDMVA
jgi:hypothetical protein